MDSADISEDAGKWNSERGLLHYSSKHEELGIIRTVVEVFTVGPFRYSKLEDALAQAQRDRLGT